MKVRGVRGGAGGNSRVGRLVRVGGSSVYPTAFYDKMFLEAQHITIFIVVTWGKEAVPGNYSRTR
jgi:hypothetical protein